MADFYQTGVVSTFHRFGNTDLERMEGELFNFNRSSPIALVLPATYTELEAPAIEQIVKDIAAAQIFVGQTVAVLIGERKAGSKRDARQYLDRLEDGKGHDAQE